MNPILTNLNDAITNLINTVSDTAAALFANANKCKDDYRAAYLALERSADDITDFTDVVSRLDDIHPITLKCDEVAEYIYDMLEDAYVFESPVEEFDGYCDVCGKELTRDDPVYSLNDDEYVCEECQNAIAEQEEADECDCEENDEAPLNPMDSPCAYD